METSKSPKIPFKVPEDPRLDLVRRVSILMDSQFKIGKFRFGVDPLLNLFPVAGDIGGYLVTIVLILTMMQHGISGKAASKMLGNATLDALVGTIPLLGWIFDFTYKANLRNMKILTEFYTEGKHKGSARPFIAGFLLIAAAVLGLVIYLSILLFRLLDQSLTQALS